MKLGHERLDVYEEMAVYEYVNEYEYVYVNEYEYEYVYVYEYVNEYVNEYGGAASPAAPAGGVPNQSLRAPAGTGPFCRIEAASRARRA